QRPLVWRVKEDGVVAESGGSAGFRGEAPFDRRGGLEQNPAPIGEDHGADKTSGAAGGALRAKRGVNQLKPIRVRRPGSAEPGGPHARRAAKRIDLQPRVFGYGQCACRLRVVQRLGPGVLDETWRV